MTSIFQRTLPNFYNQKPISTIKTECIEREIIFFVQITNKGGKKIKKYALKMQSSFCVRSGLIKIGILVKNIRNMIKRIQYSFKRIL